MDHKSAMPARQGLISAYPGTFRHKVTGRLPAPGQGSTSLRAADPFIPSLMQIIVLIRDQYAAWGPTWEGRSGGPP
jgi:hypothetical protein